MVISNDCRISNVLTLRSCMPTKEGYVRTDDSRTVWQYAVLLSDLSPTLTALLSRVACLFVYKTPSALDVRIDARQWGIINVTKCIST